MNSNFEESILDQIQKTKNVDQNYLLNYNQFELDKVRMKSLCLCYIIVYSCLFFI